MKEKLKLILQIKSHPSNLFYFVRNPNQLANETCAAQHRLSSPLLLGNPASPQDKDARRIHTGESPDLQILENAKLVVSLSHKVDDNRSDGREAHFHFNKSFPTLQTLHHSMGRRSRTSEAKSKRRHPYISASSSRTVSSRWQHSRY